MSLDSLFKQDKKKTQQDFSEDEVSGEFRSRAELESSADEEKRSAKTAKRQQNSRKNLNDSAALPEKKRARRRLIGAVALVLAAVIGLPMIFDSEPKPVLQKIAIEIPSKDTPFSASTPAPARPALNDQNGLQQGIDPTEEVVKADVAAAEVKTVVTDTATKAVAAPATSVTPVTPVISGQEKSAAKVSEIKSGNVLDTVNGNATLNKPASSTSATMTNKAMVEVAKKSEAPADSKPVKKDQRDDEARALALLEGREPPAPEQRSETATAKAGSFAVQVAALNSSAKVKELQNTLKAAHIQSYTQKVITKTGEVSRVRVGPFANKAEAEKMRAKLIKLGLNGSLIPL